MPFQLIHTSSLHLLDSAGSGYGTVARSKEMPAALYRLLPALSGFKETAAPIQFSYHILTASGDSWHVLSCIQSAGADYSGRACHTAHHLIFSQQEVCSLLNNAQRPTPAGISLALLQSGFWVSRWEGEPRLLPADTAFVLPETPEHDVTIQPTWKKFSGHKANARAFYTQPYHKECVIAIPEAMTQEEILALLHESDWLSHTRGWGGTYTTTADNSDTFAETLRIFVPQNSPLVQWALRSRHAVLHINTELELPITPPPSMVLHPESSARSITHTLTRNISPYHYTEAPDWTLFDIPIPTSPYKKALATGIVGLVCCASLTLALINLTTTPPSNNAKVTTAEILIEQSPDAQLSALLSAPYNHEATLQLMQEFTMLKGNSLEETWLAECASLIRQAGSHEADHAAGLKRICEGARLLGVKDTDLVQLYMREATHALSVEEWQKKFDAVQTEEWLNLQLSEPAIAQAFEAHDLKAYIPRSEPDKEDDSPLLATATSTTETAASKASTSAPGRVSLIPHPARCGEALPLPLAEALSRLPVTISTGRYIVSILQQGDSLQPARYLELSEDGYRLHISTTGKNGEYRLTPSHKDGKNTDLPEIIIGVRNGKLRSIRSGKNYAVISFPVPQQDDFYTNVILVPDFGIPLPDGKGVSLPKTPELDFNITPADISIAGTQDKPELRLSEKKKKSGFPWVSKQELVDRHHFSITLPVLNAHNSIHVTQEANSSFICKRAVVSQETETLTTLLCDMEHIPALPERLENAFKRIANTPCCGQKNVPKGTPSLADFYSLISSLGAKKLSASSKRKLHKAYFDMLSNPHFNAELHKILPTRQNILLTPAEASASNLRSRRLRSAVSDELDTPAMQDSIRRGICELLSRSLIAAYEQEKQNFEHSREKKPALMLRNITQGAHGELLWHFHLKNTK